jgi:hypothetical protein
VLYLEFLLTYPNAKNDTTALKIKNDKQGKFEIFEKKVKSSIDKELNNKTKIGKEILKHYPLSKQYKAIIFPIIIGSSFKIKLEPKDFKYLGNLSKGLFYGWCGYTIVDDLLDNQSKQVNLLKSIKLIRLYDDCIFNIYSTKRQRSLNHTDIVDDNYYWEIEKLRFDKAHNFKEFNIDYISKRMHAFIELCADIPIFLKVKNYKQDFFSNYLKNLMYLDQLNDDSHDWKEDIENNILTLPTYLCYKKKVSLADQEGYWLKVMPKVLNKAKECYRIALENLSQLELVNNDYLLDLLNKSYLPIKNAEIELEKVKNLLKVYSK